MNWSAMSRHVFFVAVAANSCIATMPSTMAWQKVWEMVKRISGKSQPSTIHHLLVNDNKVEHPKDIANTLASSAGKDHWQD
jgi:hypothetical protein